MARVKTVAKDALPATQVARLVPKWALNPTVARRSSAYSSSSTSSTAAAWTSSACSRRWATAVST
jgi:hypothetical protein